MSAQDRHDRVPVIEFVGLPRSGKTTLVRGLLANPELAAHDLVGAVLLERGNLWTNLLCISLSALPKNTSRSLTKRLARTRSPTLSELRERSQTILRHHRNERTRHMTGQTLRIYAALEQTLLTVYTEEGVLQRIYSANPTDDPALFFSSAPQLRAIIHLDTPPIAAMSRLRKRRSEKGLWGVSRLEGRPSQEVFRDVEANFAFNHAGLTALADSQRVLRLDATANPREVLSAATSLSWTIPPPARSDRSKKKFFSANARGRTLCSPQDKPSPRLTDG